jgi:ATP-dependent DNA helicase RecG
MANAAPFDSNETNESNLTPLEKVGINNAHEALLTVPRKYLDFSTQVDPKSLGAHLGERVNIELKVTSPPCADLSDPTKSRFKVEAMDRARKTHRMMVFGLLKWSPWKHVNQDEIIRVSAKVTEFNGSAYLNSPELIQDEHWGRVVPVYRSVPGRLSGEKFALGVSQALGTRYAIENAMLQIRQAFDGMSEAEIKMLTGLRWSLIQVVSALHAPKSFQHAQWAAMAAKKLAVAAVRHKAAKTTNRAFDTKSVIRIDHEKVDAMLFDLPMRLTAGAGGQIDAIQGICDALAAPHPMDALLSADVGTGKTIMYMIPSVIAQSQGKKVAIMIPNGLLVEQVAAEFRLLYPRTPIQLVDGIKSKDVPWDVNPILIGTTGIIGLAATVGWVPDFLIIDESQKTSRAQRDALRASHTNVLESTATALPRSLALILHGGKQLIQVSKQHAEKRIVTRVVGASDKQDMLRAIRETIASGKRAALIYPKVSGNDENDKLSVQNAGATWEKFFPGKVAVLHGKMKDEDKFRIMAAVKDGVYPLLCASSIIEVGTTIKDLALLIVVCAERYGLSTLHQFRGRLVRHGGDGTCLLYSPDPIEDDTLERLKLMEKTNNGFELAELDCSQRGFGDLGSESDDQSGASFTIFRDLRLMPQDFE